MHAKLPSLLECLCSPFICLDLQVRVLLSFDLVLLLCYSAIIISKEDRSGCVRGTSSLGFSTDFCEPDQVMWFQKPHGTAGV